MAAQSLLAKLGMRAATLGTVASLALAAPLAEGNPSMAAHTDASRIGWYFDRTGGSEKIGHVVMGVESLSVKAAGIAVPGTVAIGQATASYKIDVLVSGNDGLRVANGSNEVYLGTTAAQAAVGTLTANSFAVITSGGVSVLVGATGDVSVLSGMLKVSAVGKGLSITEGANAKMGVAVLVAGSNVVSNTSVTANSRIFLTSQVDGGVIGVVRVTAISAGVSFTITSSSGTDTSTIAYIIVEP